MAALGLCCGERGILRSCSVWTAHWGGFSCCRAWALQHSSVVVVLGLGAPQHVRFSKTRDQTRVPCTGRRILNHWTTRDVPSINFSFQYDTNVERWQMLSIYIKSRKDPEITFLVVLIFIPSFIPKLTNIWTSNTEDSFCLFLNYIKVTWHNLWDCPTFSTKCLYQLTHPTAVYESFTRPTSFPTSETENLLKFKSLSGCVWM